MIDLIQRTTLLFILLCFTTTQTQAETLHIVGDDSAKPKNWMSADGHPRGLMVDLLGEVSKRTGIEFTIELAPWNRSFQLSAQGHGAIIGFSKTKEREQSWDYSVPMYFDELVIVTSKSKTFSFTGLNSLSGKRVAIKRGSSYGDDFEQAKKEKLFEIIETTDRAGQIRMLTLNRVDAILLSPGKIALETVISENDWLAEHKNKLIILSPPYKRDPNYLGIPKSMNQSHLLEPINKALEAIRADGTYQEIVERNIKLVLEGLN